MQYIFKEMVRDLPYLRWFNIGGFGQLADAFSSPAARQMLITYADYSNSPFNWTPNLTTLSPLRSAFAQRLQAKGYPQQTRNFGVAFGRGNNTVGTKDAGNGRQFTPASPFNPQTEIFNGAIGFFLINLQTLANAVPENNTKATIAYYDFLGITFRKIFGIAYIPVVTLRVRRFDYTGQYPYDDAPGSFEQTQTQFVQSWARGIASKPTTNRHDGHNFVSTVSALDLQNQTYGSANKWQSNNLFFRVDNQIQNIGLVNGNTLITPTLSPFRAVITGTSNCGAGCTAEQYTDENDSQITPSNGNQWNHFHECNMTFQFATFIETNILNSIPVSCAGANGLCNSNPIISGLDLICTNGQYQLVGTLQGITILWEMQNGNLKIDGGQGTPTISVSKLNTGPEIIKVTLTNTCGASLVLTKSINVGPAPININYSMTGPCNGSYQSWSLNASSTSVVSSWSWTVDNPGAGSWVIYSPNSASTIVAVSGGGGISVTATNACGTSRSGVTIWSNCHFLTATPNPATDNVNVAIHQPTGVAAAKEKKAIIYRIKVTDLPGNMKKQYKYSAGVSNANISLSGLSKGVYLIQAFDGTSWSSVKVIKQ